MQSIIVILNVRKPIEWFADHLNRLGAIHIASPHRLVVEQNSSWLAVDLAQSIGGDYDESELAQITLTINTPFFVCIEFNGISLAEQTILAISRETTCLIDNDHGWIATSDEIQKAIRDSIPWLRNHQPSRVFGDGSGGEMGKYRENKDAD